MTETLDPSDYRLSQTGIIQTPGKFEGEMLYVPYFWDMCMEGWAETASNGDCVIEVTQGDKDYFDQLHKDNRDPGLDQPLALVAKHLRRRKSVRLRQRDDGFVFEIR